MFRSSLAVTLLLAATGVSYAQQQEIEWKQTINMPKGQNIPRDRADILGIEIGDTYQEAKEKLQKLAAEGIQPKAKTMTPAERAVARMNGERSGPPPMKEEKRIYNLKAPGANSTISASFVQTINISREMASGSGKKYSENVAVILSAPSSGHQVIGVTRSIYYGADGDQPLISDTLAQLKAKMKFEPQVIHAGGFQYRFQFNDGKPYAPPKPSLTSCVVGYGVDNATNLRQVNESGDCDALLEISSQTGISANHASILFFKLGDNDRTKANLTADFAFLSDYVSQLQQNTRGAPPKL
ncbi:hypothetical protein IVB46_41845 [Bradyrhizobium sp. 61]|uniref:hypothetical protein n=1 Tax=Bradyrhizobium sp. 61 TaxID=2782679 RepID=UPI001FF7A829|nr:hypothetical protein [Bradyrhizobium sp. 61]MCK1281778.1 hypothetical protein [Bradyrhizobium sp. 61]